MVQTNCGKSKHENCKECLVHCESKDASTQVKTSKTKNRENTTFTFLHSSEKGKKKKKRKEKSNKRC